MKTVFISSFHSLVSRVLESGILDFLKKDANLRVVIFCPGFKKDYFVEKFADKNVIIEGIDTNMVPKRSFLFQKLSLLLLNTGSMKIIKRSYRTYKNYFHFLSAHSVAVLFGRWKLARKIFRGVNYYFSGKPVFASYFEKYKPDLVFSTDIKNVLDTALITEAKKRKIFTLSMVRSWDYLTAKGIARVLPDKMLVHNEIIKREAIKYADMEPEDVLVVGIPHYDPYVNAERSSKEAFFDRIGFDADKPLVLWIPLGDKFLDIDWQFLNIIADAINEGKLPKDLRILVRMPPTDTVDMANFKKSDNILFDYPGIQFGGRGRKANEMSFDDLLHLADSIFYSRLIIGGGSTVCIDAAAFDKPVILLNFDGKEKRNYYDSIKNHYDYCHLKNLVNTGGVSLAGSEEELIRMINEYLEKPEFNKEGRQRIVKEQCWKLDGKASERTADFIKKFL